MIEGRWFFKCQNGFNECLKNKWQVCSIQVLLYKVQVLAHYLVCYMNSTDEIRSGYQVRIIFISTIYLHNVVLICEILLRNKVNKILIVHILLIISVNTFPGYNSKSLLIFPYKNI